MAAESKPNVSPPPAPRTPPATGPRSQPPSRSTAPGISQRPTNLKPAATVEPAPSIPKRAQVSDDIRRILAEHKTEVEALRIKEESKASSLTPAFTPAPPKPPEPVSLPMPPSLASPPASPAAPIPAPIPFSKAVPPEPAPAPLPSEKPKPLTEAPAAAAAATPAPPADASTLVIALSTLAGGWPDDIRKEIVDLNMAQAKLCLPVGVVRKVLKQGRIAFSWRLLRSCLKPAPQSTSSPHDAVELELPLKIVAPLFLTIQRKNAAPKAKVTVDESVPDLFSLNPAQPSEETATPVAAASGAPAAPVPEPAPASIPADTNPRLTLSTPTAPVPPVPSPAPTAPMPAAIPMPPVVPVAAQTPIPPPFVPSPAPAELKLKAAPAIPMRGAKRDTLALEPEPAEASSKPAEIVARSMELKGVEGAIILLHDGCVVAGQLPASVERDALAAFIPQIVGKLDECATELGMPQLTRLNFALGGIPWNVFRQNKLVYVALGASDTPLPSSKLASLAAELENSN